MNPELYIFARFHAHPGFESAVEAAMLDVLGPSREEAGCVSIHAFRSIRDARLFYIHSVWTSEAAFEIHARLEHTERFEATVTPLIDHPFDLTRTSRFE